MKYGVFEEVLDDRQETIGSRWVITKKEKAYGQKTNYKRRLVVRGFQEKKLHNLIPQQCLENL